MDPSCQSCSQALSSELSCFPLSTGWGEGRARLGVTWQSMKAGGSQGVLEVHFPECLMPLTPLGPGSLPRPVQEVVSHCKKLTKKNKEQLSDMMALDKQKGIKALSKEKRQKLEAYQHLFYLLQVNGGWGACY